MSLAETDLKLVHPNIAASPGRSVIKPCILAGGSTAQTSLPGFWYFTVTYTVKCLTGDASTSSPSPLQQRSPAGNPNKKR